MTTPPNRFDSARWAVPVRRGPPPETTHPTREQPGPHEQLSDIAPRELQEELLRRVRTLPDVEVGWSAISVPYARGFHLKPHAARGPAEAFQRGSEFGHLHPEHDGSSHQTLPSALYNEVLRAGWGEPHPISATVMVFGARDEVELDVVWQLVCASHSWATATKDDETPLHGLPTKNPRLPLGAAPRKVLGCGGGMSAAAPAARDRGTLGLCRGLIAEVRQQ